ncbi:hypothetical protein GCM10022231_24380 [Gordonia caeni]|uniref:Transposase n=1 Tax=Gordonia caeni TaxID=1007097 RepID=A0ABP7PC57_9ACTN
MHSPYDRRGLHSTDFEAMVGAARAAGRGWAWIARELGMSQTPLRRWAEGQGLSLPRELPASSAERLADLRAHLDAGGTLADAPRPLQRWLSSRRWARQHQRDGRVDRELDLIAPDWDQP